MHPIVALAVLACCMSRPDPALAGAVVGFIPLIVFALLMRGAWRLGGNIGRFGRRR